MTDYPIPDELRDQFLAVLTVPTMRELHVGLLVGRLNFLAKQGAHIELRLPEFAVHDDACCGGSGESCGHIIRCDKRPGIIGSACTLRVPCPGVGYYHWTQSRDR